MKVEARNIGGGHQRQKVFEGRTCNREVRRESLRNIFGVSGRVHFRRKIEALSWAPTRSCA